MKGRFLVIEGADGAGTTTQSRRLVERLNAQGHRAHWTREPSDGPVGTMIRQILTGRLVAGDGHPVDPRTLAALFAADRLDHLHAEIEPLLAKGTHVVSDRYLLSSLAYQSLECDPKWVRELNALARAPDATFFLSVRPEIALKRRAAVSARLERFERLEIQKRVARAYERAIRAGSPVVRIDGEQPEGKIAEELWKRARALLGKKRVI